MKSTAVVCAVLASSIGFSGIASAQQWSGHHDGGHPYQQQQQVQQPREQHWQHQENRSWNQPRHEYRQQPRYEHHQPRYVYEQPRYHHGARFYRGGYVPRAYLSPGYYVDYRAYPGLYAPPYGYQWVNVDGEFLLVALTTGLIANLLINGGY